MLYVYTHMLTGCCELSASTIHRTATCRRNNPNVIGDNWCGWKEEALLKTLGITDSDIIHANFVNGVSCTPYVSSIMRVSFAKCSNSTSVLSRIIGTTPAISFLSIERGPQWSSQ